MSTTTRRDREVGLALGLLGVLGFSFSLPATKVAVGDLDPWFVAFGRAAGAAVLAAIVLAATRARRPTRAQWRALAVVSGGVIVGFPLFTSLGLEHADAAHGAVVIAVLPAATAVAAVLRAGEHPSPAFWAAALAGLAVVAAFALSGASGGLGVADGWFVAAVVVCAFGYAEGGVLARDLGGAQTISWALVATAPIAFAVAAITWTDPAQVSVDAWLCFAYASVIAMFLGFFAWYGGLARGGVAHVSQVQLVQPPLTLLWSGVVLGEHVGVWTLVAALAVLACVAVAQRSRVVTDPVAPEP